MVPLQVVTSFHPLTFWTTRNARQDDVASILAALQTESPEDAQAAQGALYVVIIWSEDFFLVANTLALQERSPGRRRQHPGCPLI